MDIGDQKRVIVVEPERIVRTAPAQPQAPVRTPEPAKR
jgi:hypothetical protein